MHPVRADEKKGGDEPTQRAETGRSEKVRGCLYSAEQAVEDIVDGVEQNKGQVVGAKKISVFYRLCACVRF